MGGRQIDDFEKINRLCHSLAEFAHAGCANGSPGTSQNQEQFPGSLPIGTFARICQVTRNLPVIRPSSDGKLHHIWHAIGDRPGIHEESHITQLPELAQGRGFILASRFTVGALLR
jgi:hypothetical protein